MCLSPPPCGRAGNAIFTALEQSQEAIEITSEDQVIQVNLDHSFPIVTLIVSLSLLPFVTHSLSLYLSLCLCLSLSVSVFVSLSPFVSQVF